MKFIKRFIFVIILLLAAFGIYRLVSPTAAKALLQDMKSFSDDRFGTNFVVIGELEEPIVETGMVLNDTGVLVEADSVLEELSDGDELLLGDNLTQEVFGDDTTIPVVEENTQESVSTVAPSPTSTTTTPQTPPSSSNNGLSTQDKRDLDALLQNFTD